MRSSTVFSIELTLVNGLCGVAMTASGVTNPFDIIKVRSIITESDTNEKLTDDAGAYRSVNNWGDRVCLVLMRHKKCSLTYC